MTTQSSKLGKELKGMIKGSVLSADDPGYEEARQIWNAMIDRRPAMIVQCADADDVPTAIAFARRQQTRDFNSRCRTQHRRQRPLQRWPDHRFFEHEERSGGRRKEARLRRAWGDARRPG